jgi:hypothetical protein
MYRPLPASHPHKMRPASTQMLSMIALLRQRARTAKTFTFHLGLHAPLVTMTGSARHASLPCTNAADAAVKATWYGAWNVMVITARVIAVAGAGADAGISSAAGRSDTADFLSYSIQGSETSFTFDLLRRLLGPERRRGTRATCAARLWMATLHLPRFTYAPNTPECGCPVDRISALSFRGAGVRALFSSTNPGWKICGPEQMFLTGRLFRRSRDRSHAQQKHTIFRHGYTFLFPLPTINHIDRNRNRRIYNHILIFSSSYLIFLLN